MKQFATSRPFAAAPRDGRVSFVYVGYFYRLISPRRRP
jgi:hypothetical protein